MQADAQALDPGTGKRSAYDKALAAAERQLAKLREQGRARLEELAGELREALAQRAKDRGKMDAAGLDRHIEQCRNEIARYNRLVSADSPEAAGGYIDLTLDDYAARLGTVSPLRQIFATPRADNRTIIIAAAIGIVVAVTAVWGVFRWGGAVEFRVAGADPGRETVRFTCENRTASPLYCISLGMKRCKIRGRPITTAWWCVCGKRTGNRSDCCPWTLANGPTWAKPPTASIPSKSVPAFQPNSPTTTGKCLR